MLGNSAINALLPTIDGTEITNTGIYQLSNSTNGFEVKTYSKDSDIYILVKGKYNGKNTILVNKMAGSHLYEYFFFFPGNATFSYETLDAVGGKVHINDNLQFLEGVQLRNVKELTAAGKIYFEYMQHVPSGQEDVYITSRSPWRTPPVNAPNVYRNIPDGHYPGDRYGLYMEDTSTPLVTDFILWDGLAVHPPIPVSIEDVSLGPVPGSSEAVWASRVPVDYSYIYQQNDVNCVRGQTCANGAEYNANYYNLLPKVNGHYIPNRLPATTYNVLKYKGTSEGAEEVTVDLADSQEQHEAWDAFINSIPMEQLDTNTVTGLGGAIKAGARNGASWLEPPRIDIGELIAAAQTPDGMTLTKREDDGSIDITINGTTTNLTDLSPVGCPNHDVFTKKTFMNHETALKNEAVEINIGEMKACDVAEPGQWIPNNNLLYSNYGVILANAASLPDKGLTSIVQGNFYLKGQYNSPVDPSNPDEIWTWQPSAAIVSESHYSYLLSADFNYPQTLPHQQRHPEYPNAGTYDNSGVLIPEGVGDYDFVQGQYNWQSRHDPDMANKVTGTDHTLEYNISLIGTNAYNPRFLERWNYYGNVGDDSTPPSGWTKYDAVVNGAFIQLSNEFTDADPSLSSPVNARNCDSQISGITTIDVSEQVSFNQSNYPCRGTDNRFPSDLLAWNNNEKKQYESQFLSNTLRPPGYLSGLQQFAIIEIAATDANWSHHNNSIFSISEETPPPDDARIPEL